MEQLIDFHAPEVQAVLDTLLKDKSTGKNIIWATDPPEELQTVMYEPVTDRSQITTQQLGLTHYEVVLPRMMKQTDTQQQRTRKKGEVFSPAWVCNKMNNALDADWFRGLGAGETAGQFTVELPQGWQTVETPVQFPVCKGRTPAWVQYVQSRRLEVTCGEAPFLASRYDAATGEMIPVARRSPLPPAHGTSRCPVRCSSCCRPMRARILRLFCGCAAAGCRSASSSGAAPPRSGSARAAGW